MESQSSQFNFDHITYWVPIGYKKKNKDTSIIYPVCLMTTKNGSLFSVYCNIYGNTEQTKWQGCISFYFFLALLTESPESGGVAWHIPLDVPQNKSKLSGARRTMPLQERKLLTNTLSKKAREQLLQTEDLEPLQGWQMRQVMDHNDWHKLDHRQGISNELWEHVSNLLLKTHHFF